MGKRSVRVLDRRVDLSNLEKVLYPSEGFTKARVLDYYRSVAPWLLPHLRLRPLTLKRYPDGVRSEPFYQKECPGHRPDWIRVTPVVHSDDESVGYCTIVDLPSLMWVANLASLELHVLLSRSMAPKRPTAVVFDLDPGPGAGLLETAKVALILHRILERIELASIAKVSGRKGLHCYVPLNAPYDFEQTKNLARTVARKMESHYPELVTSKMAKRHRDGKVLIDWRQNGEHRTTVCAYSLRATDTPQVSAPVSWKEVADAVETGQAEKLRFHANEMIDRLEERGDLFAPALTLRQKIPSMEPADVGPVDTWETQRNNAARRDDARRPAARNRSTSPRLAAYREKRDFKKTAEPSGSGPSSSPRAIFVVQKHHARSLHYDLRLEWEGALKSWAVPKGPSLDPSQKRLAVEVEDHPLEYAAFEGRIPKGEYGGGVVIVWDRGTYTPVGPNGPHNALKQGLDKGRVEISLHGAKLQGRFLLVRTEGRTENKENRQPKKPQWLLIKKRDLASQDAVDPLDTEPYSVISGLWAEDLEGSTS